VQEEAAVEELAAAKAAQEAAEVVASFVEAAAEAAPAAAAAASSEQKPAPEGGNGGWPLGWLWSAVTSPFAPKQEQPQAQQQEQQPPAPVTAPPVQILEGADDIDDRAATLEVAAEQLGYSLAQQEQEQGKGAWGVVDSLWGLAVGGAQGIQGLWARQQQEQQERQEQDGSGALALRSAAVAAPPLPLEEERVSRGIRVSLIFGLGQLPFRMID
jgi:hypothetical protein